MTSRGGGSIVLFPLKKMTLGLTKNTEFVWINQELNNLLQLPLSLVAALHVLEGHLQ